MGTERTIISASPLWEVQQHCFNLVVQGMRTQKWERCLAGGPFSACIWRNDKGRHCAIGFLLELTPEALAVSYEEQVVARGMDFLREELKEWVAARDTTQSEGQDALIQLNVFLQEMEDTHDCCVAEDLSVDKDRMEQRFRNVGLRYHLEWPEGTT